MAVAGALSARCAIPRTCASAWGWARCISNPPSGVIGYGVQQLMSTRIISCRSSDRVDAVLATMTTARIRHLPVIEDKELKGIVSIGDLVKHRLDEKELEASVLLDIARMRA